MRKIFLTISLSLALTVCCFAGGNTPITGVAGCAPGLYYPDTGECVLDLSAPVQGTKEDPVFSETSLVGAILSFGDIIF